MNTSSPSPSTGQPVRCWCGNSHLEDFSPDYWRCPECQTLVLREMRPEEISQVRDDEHDFYGKNYYLHHLHEEHGYPDLETRARADLPERCLHWLQTLLKFVPGPGAHTLELGCGHGGFVAMQRWAGLDATGLELSPWLVRQAREFFGVPILEGRLEDQDLAAGSWDAVVLMDVLEHLPDPRQTLGRAVSLLRSPSSFLLIQTPCYPAGWSYEALRAQDHPFLRQLKPSEHLYLFSEQAVQRLCAELGVGQVRFEPPIFAHYDLFAVASAGPLRERPVPERTEMLMAASPPARWTLALLDLGTVRDDLHTRLAALSAEFAELQTTTAELWPRLDAAENARNLAAAQLADVRGQFERLETDNAARLEVIERQGAELSRLHAEVDLRLKEAAEFWPRLDAAVNERNLLAAQMQDLHAHFERSEADRASRLETIERQGTEMGELRARLSLTTSELTDLHGHFERSEADRAARLEIIESQGAVISQLQRQLAANEAERERLSAHLGETQAAHAMLTDEHERLSAEADETCTAHATLTDEYEAAQKRQETLDKHWTTRLLKKTRLWPL